MKMEQSVPKRRHLKFRRRGIAQKKEYNMEHRECSETSALKIQTPVNRPKEGIQHTILCCNSENFKIENGVAFFVCFLDVIGVKLFKINVRGM